MNCRRILLAAVLVVGLFAPEARADRHCGGITSYFDWACGYVPRTGWQWQLVEVGTQFCLCDTDCVLLGQSTACRGWSMTDTCGGGDSCSDNFGWSCSLPEPDPRDCTGPVPPTDREGWALHDGTTGTYSPDRRFSFNSSGSTNAISNPGTGHFTITFPGLGGLDGNVQVVAYGSSNHRCKVENWTGIPDLTVDVRCQTPVGVPVNTPFLVYFFATNDTATSAREIGHARYDWPPQPFEPPNPAFQWNSNGPLPVTTRLEGGSYAVRFRNLMHADGAPVVTALGAGPEFCQVLSTGRYADGTDTGTEVRVWCFDTGGRLADSSFTLRYEWQRTVPGAQVLEGYAFAHHATAASYSPTPQFNSAGQANLATRLGTGAYALTYNGLPAPVPGPDPHPDVRASTVLLSAQALGPSYCKVLSWGGSGDQTTVNARCYNHTGALGDRTYEELYLTRRPAEPPNNP